tara:strand:+ start:593 stop:1498 length:906 start_codon:yes stop_codon:yes gene_type:complete
MKRQHEGLQGYLKQLRGAGDVAVTSLHPRIPVGPTDAIPIGIRPIPTSSQGPKRTNATIVYARTAVKESRTLGPFTKCVAEGDVVLTQRIAPATRAPLGLNVKVVSMKLLNQDIVDASGGDPEVGLTANEAQKFFYANGQFTYTPDGIVNNLDGGDDPENEYKDHSIANVAIQGFCRFSTYGIGQRRVRNGDSVYVGLTKAPGKPNAELKETTLYTFEILLASQFTSSKVTKEIERIWKLGRVVDGNQSKNMITICVGVDEASPSLLKEQWLDKEGWAVMTAAKAANAAKEKKDGGKEKVA